MPSRDKSSQTSADKAISRRSVLRAALWTLPATGMALAAGAQSAFAATTFEFTPSRVVIPDVNASATVTLAAYHADGRAIAVGETVFVGVSHGVRWADGTVFPRFFKLTTAGRLEITGLRVENKNVLPGMVTASFGEQKAVAYIELAPPVYEFAPPAIGAGHLYWWNEADGRIVKDVAQVCETWDQNPWGTIRSILPVDIRPTVAIDSRARDAWLYDGPQQYMGGLNKSEMDGRPLSLPVSTGAGVKALSSTRWAGTFYTWRYISRSGETGLCEHSTQAPLDQGTATETDPVKKHWFPEGRSAMTERGNKTVKDLAATSPLTDASLKNPVPFVLFDDGELCTISSKNSPMSTVVAATNVSAIAHVCRGTAFKFADNNGRIGTYTFTEGMVSGNVNPGATTYSSRAISGTPIAISWHDSTEPFVLMATGDLYYAPTNVALKLVASNVSAIEKYGMRSGNNNGIFFGTKDGKLWQWFSNDSSPTQIGSVPGVPKSLYHWGANAYYVLTEKGAFHRISGGVVSLVTDKYVTAVPISISKDAAGRDVVRFAALSGQSVPRCEIYR